jgi:hypothetical protein
MNGSPPPPPETVAPVPIPVVTAAETNVAGTNSAITVITAKAIVSFFTFHTPFNIFYFLVVFLINDYFIISLYCLTWDSTFNKILDIRKKIMKPT